MQISMHTVTLHVFSFHAKCLYIYSAHMSPETTPKLMGFYMEVLILGVILEYMVSASLPLEDHCHIFVTFGKIDFL